MIRFNDEGVRAYSYIINLKGVTQMRHLRNLTAPISHPRLPIYFIYFLLPDLASLAGTRKNQCFFVIFAHKKTFSQKVRSKIRVGSLSLAVVFMLLICFLFCCLLLTPSLSSLISSPRLAWLCLSSRV